MNLKTEHGKKLLEREYVQKQRGTYEIATELGTYPNAINRALRYHGIPVREKSDATSLSFKKGRVHPTKGKQRSKETKLKIGHGISTSWKNISKEEREKRCKRFKDAWDNMSDEKRRKFNEASQKAIRKAADEGSKLEKYLFIALKEAGYDVRLHEKRILGNSEMEVDLFLPFLRVGIEIDGPTHFNPIWGQERLERVLESDARKNGLLNQFGYKLIRINYTVKAITDIFKHTTLKNLLETLKYIQERKAPPKFDGIQVL